METKENINILAIESSCDETAAAIVCNGVEVKSNIIASQIDIHKQYGGVVPEIASRHHVQAIVPVVDDCLAQAGMTFADLDGVAVSAGPGLVGALLVGVSYAKALSMAIKKPLIGVHHWEAHLSAIYLEHNTKPPFLALVVSGSHSGIVHVADVGDYRLLGESRDDAAGEAFDKISRALGLGYPGGPQIQAAALKGQLGVYDFPRAWLEADSYDFSFSGLKSSVLNFLNKRSMKGESLTDQDVCDIAAAVQDAIVDVLSAKTVRAARELNIDTIAIAGGVAANLALRQRLLERAGEKKVVFPSPVFCTDNAAMVGAAAYHKFLKHDFADLTLNANPRLPLYRQLSK